MPGSMIARTIMDFLLFCAMSRRVKGASCEILVVTRVPDSVCRPQSKEFALFAIVSRSVQSARLLGHGKHAMSFLHKI